MKGRAGDFIYYFPVRKNLSMGVLDVITKRINSVTFTTEALRGYGESAPPDSSQKILFPVLRVSNESRTNLGECVVSLP